jgi:hypothetical protein
MTDSSRWSGYTSGMEVAAWSTGEDDPQVAEALAAERETLSLECRSDARRLDAYLAEDFHEFGSSGREIGRAGTAERVAGYTDRDGEGFTIEALRGLRVADGIVMVKYTSDGVGVRSHRTSLWRRVAPGRWEMFHHQGTPTRS